MDPFKNVNWKWYRHVGTLVLNCECMAGGHCYQTVKFSVILKSMVDF